MERHVDSRRYSRRCDDFAGVDEAVVRTRLDVTAERNERIERAPVGRRREPVEEAGVREDERAGTDARHQRATRPQRPDPLAHALVPDLRARAAPARIDEHVDRAEVVPRHFRQHAHPLRAGDRLEVVSDEADAYFVRIGVMPGGKHFPRADEVELLGAFEDSYRYGEHDSASCSSAGVGMGPGAIAQRASPWMNARIRRAVVTGRASIDTCPAPGIVTRCVWSAAAEARPLATESTLSSAPHRTARGTRRRASCGSVSPGMPPDASSVSAPSVPFTRNGRSNSSSVACENDGGFGPHAPPRIAPTSASDPVTNRYTAV